MSQNYANGKVDMLRFPTSHSVIRILRKSQKFYQLSYLINNLSFTNSFNLLFDKILTLELKIIF